MKFILLHFTCWTSCNLKSYTHTHTLSLSFSLIIPLTNTLTLFLLFLKLVYMPLVCWQLWICSIPFNLFLIIGKPEKNLLRCLLHWPNFQCIIPFELADFEMFVVIPAFKSRVFKYCVLQSRKKRPHVKVLCLFYIRRPVPDHPIGWKVFQNFHKILLFTSRSLYITDIVHSLSVPVVVLG